MHELQTRIEIAAPQEQVWDVLTDFPAYSRWNPFIRHVDGFADDARALDVYVHLRDARHARLRAVVLVVDAPREMRWRTHVLTPRVFVGEYRFALEPLPDGGVRFEQSLCFGGLLTPFLHDRIDRSVSRALREMNAALKGHVERARGACPSLRGTA